MLLLLVMLLVTNAQRTADYSTLSPAEPSSKNWDSLNSAKPDTCFNKSIYIADKEKDLDAEAFLLDQYGFELDTRQSIVLRRMVSPRKLHAKVDQFVESIKQDRMLLYAS